MWMGFLIVLSHIENKDDNGDIQNVPDFDLVKTSIIPITQFPCT